MNELMIEQWNKQVSNNDLVYHLGDVSFGNMNETRDVLSKLNGRIVLILGNHDKHETMKQLKRFESIHNYLEVGYKGHKFVMFHYPIFEWNQLHRGYIHLHGHVHGRNLPMPEGRMMDVGIDTRTDMGLYSLDEVIELMKDKPIRCYH